MTLMQIGFLVLVFVAAAIVALVVFLQVGVGPVRARLEQLADGHEGEAPENQGWIQHIIHLTGPLAKLSLPSGDWEQSRLRIHFMNAGYRNPSAPVLFFTAKTLLTFVLPGLIMLYAALVGVSVVPNIFLAALVGFAAIGYFLPNVVLARRITARKREIFEHFPDAIDLMTVCVEAGLGLDAALARVGEEMALASPILAEELHLVNLELRAGSTRERALRNLALRTGVEEVDMLVAMLVQSDRFGTSVATALRVHSESLRSKRRLRAEEMAAKIPVKLLFPTIFFIFPSMLLVLLGPAFINIYRVLLPSMSGQK